MAHSNNYCSIELLLSCLLFLLFETVVCLASGIDKSYNGPFRDWMTGHWQGNPLYSPIGPFKNYSIIFREYNSSLYPTNTVLVEAQNWENTPINGSYQRWMIVDNTISYCGLLTFDDGIDYLVAMPTFHYQPQMSNDEQVVFCGHPVKFYTYTNNLI